MINIDELPIGLQTAIKQSDTNPLQLLADATAAILPEHIGKTRRTRHGMLHAFINYCYPQQEYTHSILVAQNKEKFVMSRFALGLGGSGRVKLGIDAHSASPVAIKIYSDADPLEIAQIIQNLKQDDCYINHIHTDGKDYIITKFAPGDNLLDVLFHYEDQKSMKKHISFADQLELAISAVEEINKRHQKGLIICDIKPNNFIAYHNKCTIIDLDHLHRAGEKSGSKALVTHGYIALEYFSNGFNHTQQTDIYALGATLMDIFSPFDCTKKTTQTNLAENALEYRDNPPHHNSIERKIWEVCCEMVSPHSKTRPTSMEVLKRLQDIRMSYQQKNYKYKN